MLLLACILCACSTIPLVVEAIKRTKNEPSVLTWVLLALSLVWCLVFVCGSLRVIGILPPVDDGLTTREITHFLGNNITVFVATGGCLCVLVMDLFLWLLIHKINNQNKMWWICGSLLLFLVVVFLVACIAYFLLGGAYSLDQLFFGGCCATMALPGWAVGLTYKEICVIVNIYLEAGLCLLSALWLAKVLVRRVKDKNTILNCTLVSVGVVYAIVCVIVFIGIVVHYAPPLDVAFDKCYYELINLAGEQNTTYNIVNYVIFIAGFLVLVLFNCIVGYALQPKKKEQRRSGPDWMK